jgi:type I restriction enzyme, S subunit
MKLVPLKELAKVDWGNTSLTKSSYIPNGEFIAVSATGCDGRINHAEHQNGTLVLSAIGANCGKMFLPDGPFTAIKNTITIFPNEFVDSNYLFRFLNNFQIGSRGAGQPFITKSDTEKKLIPLPPLPQQQKIANILDAADALRQNDKALIAKYDELTQALFLDMFGDPVSNPKGWEKVELKKLCSFKKKNIKPEDIEEGVNYVALDSIEKVTGNITTIYNVEKGELKSNKFWFDNSYILYGKLRPYLNKVALPNFEGVCSTDIIPIQPINTKSNKLFVTSILRHNSFVAFADERSSGANLPRISPSEVEKYSTINPPLSLQNQFAERVAVIEEQKAIAQKSLEKSESLFNSLLQKAFKGELV